MTLRLHDTLSRVKQSLPPPGRDPVTLYVCGPTVYADPHLGHARAAVVFDVMTRYMRIGGRRVIHVSNVTDIDDKIIDAARAGGVHYRRLADDALRRYQDAMDRLNVRPPDLQPRVTAFIRPIQQAVQRLIQAGHAYPAGGDVYFSVETDSGYGRLSCRVAADAGRQPKPGGVSSKRHPADFALWKAARAGDPAWPSPWGPGRPGWHIECSVMCAELLGETVDIHGGGMDLIFPHHENEMAQSRCLHGKPLAGAWVHNGMVTNGSEKMSKSLGNGSNLSQVLDRWHPDALRLWLLSKRYRHPLAFSPEGLAAAAAWAARIHRCLTPLAVSEPRGASPAAGPVWKRFRQAMDDDFNFPMALALVMETVRYLNRRRHHSRDGLLEHGPDGPAAADLRRICEAVLGLRLTDRVPAGVHGTPGGEGARVYRSDTGRAPSA